VISVAPELADRVVTALALDDAALRAGVLVGGDVDAHPVSAATLPDLSACAASR
jgi:hypothetical protein